MKKILWLLLLLIFTGELQANYNLYERNLRQKRCKPGECRGYPKFNYNSPSYEPPPIAEAEKAEEPEETLRI